MGEQIKSQVDEFMQCLLGSCEACNLMEPLEKHVREVTLLSLHNHVFFIAGFFILAEAGVYGPCVLFNSSFCLTFLCTLLAQALLLLSRATEVAELAVLTILAATGVEERAWLAFAVVVKH